MRENSPSVVGSWGVAEGACGVRPLDEIEAVATRSIGTSQTNDNFLIGFISRKTHQTGSDLGADIVMAEQCVHCANP
jgi:hypothetical protein